MVKATRKTSQPQLTLEQLREEHATLDARLDELSRLRSLSPEEQYEKMVIKKRKLALKDRMARMS